MFNEQEKVARLGEDYTLRLFYKRVSNTNGYSDLEATGLSEGEKIARNFAFIVSILELANKNISLKFRSMISFNSESRLPSFFWYIVPDLNDAIVEKARIFQQEYDDMSDKEEEKERKEKKIPMNLPI